MRLIAVACVAGCVWVQGCAPPPGSYYGAPPGYAPQPYAASPGVVAQPLSPDGGAPPLDDGPGYPGPGYPLPPGYPAYGYAPPDIGYAPPRFLPPPRFYGGFGGGPGPFDRERFGRDRERERFERERFERQRREQAGRDRPRPPPPAQPLQGPARPQDFRQPAGGQPGRRGFSPEQLRQLP